MPTRPPRDLAGRAARLRVPFAAALALAVLDVRAAHALEVHNQTRHRITITMESPGTWRAELAAGARATCDPGSAACNPGGTTTSVVAVRVTADDAHFTCVAAVEAAGRVEVRETERGAIGLLPALSCRWFGGDGALAGTEPLADHAPGARSVHFLATADPQFWWADYPQKTVDEATARNRKAWAADRAMVLRLKMSCQEAGCEIRGITISGDLTNYSRRNELEQYRASLHPYEHYVYDGMGNHDNVSDAAIKCVGAPGRCVDVARIRAHVTRGRSTGLTNVQDPHYSWDWDDVHFVQLNLAPLTGPTHGMLDPYQALQFVERDLLRYVGTSGRPVVIFHHYGFDPFSADAREGNYWTDAERAAYWRVLAPYNVVAIFTGHVHLEIGDSAWFHPAWKRPPGTTLGPDSIATFVAGAALFGVFLDVRMGADSMTVSRMGLASLEDPNSAITELAVRQVPIRRMVARMCQAGVLHILGNEYVTATFHLPDAAPGTVISWGDGGAWRYKNARCYRVWWTHQAARCNNGIWEMGPNHQEGRDAACHGEWNTVQPYLEVTRR